MSKKGYIQTEEHKRNTKEKHRGMIGKKHNQSSKDKQSVASTKWWKNNKHSLKCQCCFCKAKRGETSGKNHPQFQKKQSKKQCLKKSGKNNYKWKGKEYQNKEGRWYIWILKIKYLKARYIAEQCLKRKLTKEEVVHHINEDKSDDRSENLYLFSTQGKHARYHATKHKTFLISNIIKK